MDWFNVEFVVKIKIKMCNVRKNVIQKVFDIILYLLTVNVSNIRGNPTTIDMKSEIFSYDIATSTTQYTTEVSETNPIETQIKQFLNVQPANKSLDLFIKNVFNIENPNPMYIFVLPGEKNKTLVLNRNNFDTAVYPNISAGQKFVKNGAYSNNLFTFIGSPIRNEKLTNENPKIDNIELNFKDLDESESMRIVEENVRTERNFIEFMERLNKEGTVDENNLQVKNDLKYPAKDLSKHEMVHKEYEKHEMVNKEYEDLVSPRLKYNFQIDYASDLLKPTTENTISTSVIDWKDLGLDGWIGGLREPGKDFDTIVTESRTTENSNIISSTYIRHSKPRFPIHISPEYRPIIHDQRNTPPSSIVTKTHQKKKISSSHRKAKSKYHSFYERTTTMPADQNNVKTTVRSTDDSSTVAPKTTVNSWEINLEIPSILTNLLKKDNPRIGEIADTLSKIKPKWPVTSSRSNHKDDDVFIARANNPFGHSTKWLWRNASSDYATENENRPKRGALELYSMIKCATGCDPLIFKGYGCYCGFLGSGSTLDGIDRCCRMHDYCYETSNCPMFIEYFVPYVWKCYQGRPLCAIDQGEWGGPGSCASRLCECDQTLSKCLRRFYCPRKRAVCTSSPWRLLQNVIMEI